MTCLFVYTRPAGAAWLTFLVNHTFPAGLWTEEPQRTPIGNRVTQMAYPTHDLLTRFASALRALAQRVAISMSRFAGHGNSSLYIYVVTHRGIYYYSAVIVIVYNSNESSNSSLELNNQTVYN
jgi:hypothetical protein